MRRELRADDGLKAKGDVNVLVSPQHRENTSWFISFHFFTEQKIYDRVLCNYGLSCSTEFCWV